jgi:hypothetical protein
MVDRSSSSSKCPYCGNREEHKKLKIIFEDKDQSKVREALTQMHPFDIPEKKKQGADPDPLSTIIYRYENSRTLHEKMVLVSKGLTEIRGTFTLEDIKMIDEKNAEKLLSAMLEHCHVHEVSYGRYKA